MTEFPIPGIPNIEPASHEQALDALSKCIYELENVRNRKAQLEADLAALTSTLAGRDTEYRKRLGKVISLEMRLAESNDELVRFRAALPELIGCAHGAFAACPHGGRDRDWELLCCRARAIAVKYGLLPQAKTQETDEESM